MCATGIYFERRENWSVHLLLLLADIIGRKSTASDLSISCYYWLILLFSSGVRSHSGPCSSCSPLLCCNGEGSKSLFVSPPLFVCKFIGQGRHRSFWDPGLGLQYLKTLSIQIRSGYGFGQVRNFLARSDFILFLHGNFYLILSY